MKLFFTMYKQAQRLEAVHYREMLDIGMAPHAEYKYYRTRRHEYDTMIYPNHSTLPKEKPPRGYIKSDSKQAKELMFSIFRAAGRAYGRR